MNLQTFVLFVAAVVSNSALAEGFGFKGGEPIAELQIVGEPSSTYHFDVIPPEPNPNFEEYLVIASERLGVCRVLGVSAELGEDVLNVLFAETIEKLTRRYGAVPEDSFAQKVFWDPTEHLTLVEVVRVRHRLLVRYVFRPEGDCLETAQ
ncbi:hypothetical protein [Pelagibacterium luteolum]|uniref:Uncharacterized protein n=1 Tax=Pelagibacterium luteolum TaxID=440168 RepID=A0A1G7Z526_9HYPH|nr:hypothetical protein [Pelagibacterium luteolum]SDH03695.1 hypothetical protein SAMN04487974_11763 [Pelagibacterium luteolum]